LGDGGGGGGGGGGLATLAALAASALLFGQALSAASETDENLEASVRGAYVFRTLLAEEGISMEVSNGMVTLRGNVGIPLQRELAEEAVAALPGVKSIDNQIVVKPAGPEAAEGLLALRVKTILGMHRSGRAHAARVEVKGGVVTLRGEAVDEGERALVAAQAADVEGVGEVKNELGVASPKAAEAAAAKVGNGRPAVAPGQAEPAGEVDDASVAAQVRLALRAHRSTRSLKPGVEARDGVVTLTGHVRDAAEKEHVSWLCSDILGVVKVENKMTPEPETTENQ
jgi:hyperosmotically inducible protein